MTSQNLKENLIASLKDQGFAVNGHIVPSSLSKEHYKLIQNHSRREQVEIRRPFLQRNYKVIQPYLRNGLDIDPEKIKLSLRTVTNDSLEHVIFRWWNLIWWSVPYQRAYGRQMRFIVWDDYHDAPFALIGLQSPILKMSVRDNYLKIPKENLDFIINKSMQAQRLGALPPYNNLLGGKMAALALVSDDLRESYVAKYKDVKTILKERVINPDLLFITTTSAFGKSSIYNRLKLNDRQIAISLGYTKGSGTFHVPQNLYKEIKIFLNDNQIQTNTTFGFGPSRKVKLVDKAFSLLNLNEYHYHNIQREFFLFPLVSNLSDVIQKNDAPIYFENNLDSLTDYWKNRWCISRA
jgi:hypothetical protein